MKLQTKEILVKTLMKTMVIMPSKGNSDQYGSAAVKGLEKSGEHLGNILTEEDWAMAKNGCKKKVESLVANQFGTVGFFHFAYEDNISELAIYETLKKQNHRVLAWRLYDLSLEMMDY